MCRDFGSAASLKYSFVLVTEVISSLAHHESANARANPRARHQPRLGVRTARSQLPCKWPRRWGT